jgi:hypothetical protein
MWPHLSCVGDQHSVTLPSCHRSRVWIDYIGDITHLRQQCHDSKLVIFSGEKFKGFKVLYFSTSVTMTQLLSSGEFYRLRYDNIPVKSASANISFYTNNSKMPNFEL